MTAAVERNRELARLRQARRRARLAEQAGPIPARYCLCCRAQFRPKRRDSWLCSRTCIDRVNYHRRLAKKAELAALFRGIRQHLHGERNPLTVAQLVERWVHYPREAEASYRLWFPDLCGISPEEALQERELFQQLAAGGFLQKTEEINEPANVQGGC